MSKNKNRQMRRQLERLYGKGCFFERAHIAEKIEKMGGIKTYKTFLQEKRYVGKKITLQISYHHLKHVSENGSTTVYNGANVSTIAHQYLHSLPRDQEEIINNELRQFKFEIDMAKMAIGDKNLSFDKINIPDGAFSMEDVIEIPLEDISTLQENPNKKKPKFNRAKTKKQFQQMIEESDEELDRG